MMLIWWSCQLHIIITNVIVVPHSFFFSIQSLVVPLLWTSPILYDLLV
jgi:hypothetical protein